MHKLDYNFLVGALKRFEHISSFSPHRRSPSPTRSYPSPYRISHSNHVYAPILPSRAYEYTTPAPSPPATRECTPAPSPPARDEPPASSSATQHSREETPNVLRKTEIKIFPPDNRANIVSVVPDGDLEDVIVTREERIPGTRIDGVPGTKIDRVPGTRFYGVPGIRFDAVPGVRVEDVPGILDERGKIKTKSIGFKASDCKTKPSLKVCLAKVKFSVYYPSLDG